MLQVRTIILSLSLCLLGYGQIVNSGGSAGGGGSVTSVTIAGTANQITATGTCTGTATITCTLSIPSAFVLPGTIDGLTITTTTGTLTVVNGKTLTVNKTLTLDGTDGVTLTFPATSATIARTDAGQTFTGTQVLTATLGSTSTATTQTAGDNSTKLATTAYVDASRVPIFKGYTFVVDSTAANVTSPAKAVTAGDLLVVNCRFGTGAVGTATDSASNSYTALTAQNFGTTGEQLSWAIASTTASITFTCTQASSAAGISLVALNFSGTGTTANTNTGGTNTTTAVPSLLISPAFTTTQRTLDIFCGSVASVSGIFSGLITAGGYPWVAGVSASTITGTPDQGCSYIIVSSAVPGAQAGLSYSTSAGGAASYTVLAINY